MEVGAAASSTEEFEKTTEELDRCVAAINQGGSEW
jgi:exonuclease VII small subunit